MKPFWVVRLLFMLFVQNILHFFTFSAGFFWIRLFSTLQSRKQQECHAEITSSTLYDTELELFVIFCGGAPPQPPAIFLLEASACCKVWE